MYHMDHEVEAEPIDFFLEGYDETQFYTDIMRDFHEAFLGLTEAEAEALVDEMQAAYSEPTAQSRCFRGHRAHGIDLSASRCPGSLCLSVGGVGVPCAPAQGKQS